MQFYFIRHGQSENNASWARYGEGYPRVSDPELTDVGRTQAALVARFLTQSGTLHPVGEGEFRNVSGFGITHLYTSLMVRAVQTGAAISEALGLPLVAWMDAYETGGIFMHNPETNEPEGLPGHNRAYFEQHYPHLVLPDDLNHQGWWNRPFEGREERSGRAQRFWETLLERHSGTEDRVAVVSHGGFYNYVLRVVLGLPRRDELWFVLNNVAITRIDLGERVRVAYTNRADFLPGRLVT